MAKLATKKEAAKKAPAKKAPAKKMRASTEPHNDSDFEESNVENGGTESALAETPKRTPKPKSKRGPANGVQKAKNATPKAKAKTAKAAAGKAKAKAKATGPSVAEMMQNALLSLHDRKGNTMIAIRKFITNNYQREVDNSLLYHMKKYMEKEFLADHLRMTNSKGNTIDFKKRFALMK